MNQNLSLYRIFYTTARTGNISRAAEELFISQPAVSKSISRLEQSLGTELFTRSSRGVQLTEEGELLYSHVRSAFQTLESAENQLRIRRPTFGSPSPASPPTTPCGCWKRESWIWA